MVKKTKVVSRCQEKTSNSCPDGMSNPTALPLVNLDHLSAEEQDKLQQLESSRPGSSESGCSASRRRAVTAPKSCSQLGNISDSFIRCWIMIGFSSLRLSLQGMTDCAPVRACSSMGGDGQTRRLWILPTARCVHNFVFWSERTAWRFSSVLPKKARASSQCSAEHRHKQAEVELFQERATARDDARASGAVSELPGGLRSWGPIGPRIS